MPEVRKACGRAEAASSFEHGTADIVVVEEGGGILAPNSFYCYAYAKNDATAEQILAKGWKEVGREYGYRSFRKNNIHASSAINQLR